MSRKSKSKKAPAMNSKGIKELQNAAKTLLANIRFSSLDNDIRTICITSTSLDEGKTTTAIALATAIATSGASVLLVEGDMRRRSLGKALGATPAGGAYAVLSGEERLSDVVWRTETPNMLFLDIEPNIPNPADILSSKRYVAFVETLRDSFDYVIFDTPPIGVFIDAAILGTLTDTTILCVRKGETRRADAEDALKQLRQMKCPVLGCVFTFSDEQQSDYYYAYYTKEVDGAGHANMNRIK